MTWNQTCNLSALPDESQVFFVFFGFHPISGASCYSCCVKYIWNTTILHICLIYVAYMQKSLIACGTGRGRHLVKQRGLSSNFTQRLVQVARGKFHWLALTENKDEIALFKIIFLFLFFQNVVEPLISFSSFFLQCVKEMPLRFKLGTGGSAGLNCLSNCKCDVKAFLGRNAFVLLTLAAIIIGKSIC